MDDHIRRRFVREGLELLRARVDKHKDTDYRLWQLSVIDEMLDGEFSDGERGDDTDGE